jgi:hypothetical protein
LGAETIPAGAGEDGNAHGTGAGDRVRGELLSHAAYRAAALGAVIAGALLFV